jgi:FMN phosphatase YigB (HAD superfamily)
MKKTKKRKYKPMAPLTCRALLIDLDGTILDIDQEQFVPSYIITLARRFSAYTKPESFARCLLESTRVMIENTDPSASNEAVFYDDFCRRLGQPYEAIAPIIEQFYEQDFPGLRCWGKPYPGSGRVLKAARARGLDLVLATQPVFPLTAIEQRLSWGGLSPADFDLITTAENMHFCKPREEYYREIAAKINRPPGQCLMAGNDVQEDLCASAVGMKTFLVEGFVLDQGGPAPVINYRGSLQDLANLLEGSNLET